MSTTVEPAAPVAPPQAPPAADTPVGDLPRLTASEFPALGLAKRSRWARRLAVVLVWAFVMTLLGMLVLPWQQNVGGAGRVTAFDPIERPQVIQSPVEGRVERVPVGIVDNAFVKKGDVLVEIGGIDPDLIPNLTEELNAAKSKVLREEFAVQAKQNSRETLLLNRDLTEGVIREEIEAADGDLKLKKAKVVEAEAEEFRALQFIERTQRLFDRDAVSREDLEKAKNKEKTTKAKLEAAMADEAAAVAKLEAKRKSLDQKLSDLDAKIQSVESEIENAKSKLESARKDVAVSQSKLNKQRQQVIKAERDGFVTDVAVFAGLPVKPNAKLMTLIPRTDRPAVEVWVDGNDVPLVSSIAEDGVGSHVRLQFEGWPAVQFAGWPSVAVGTFGGTVYSVAQNDSGGGKFRLIVVPDPSDLPWPSTKPEDGKRNYLRQGALTKAWVLLNQVPLGYELWRQLNGFPPTVLPGDDATSKSTSGPPKRDKASKPPKVKI